MILDACQTNKCCIPVCKGTAQYDATSWKDWVYAWNWMLSKEPVRRKACLGTFENKCEMPYLCLFVFYMFGSWLLCFSSHEYKYVSRGCQKHKKINEIYLCRWCPEVWLRKRWPTFHGHPYMFFPHWFLMVFVVMTKPSYKTVMWHVGCWNFGLFFKRGEKTN